MKIGKFEFNKKLIEDKAKKLKDTALSAAKKPQTPVKTSKQVKAEIANDQKVEEIKKELRPFENAIKVTNFTKGYKNFLAVKDANLTIGRGVIHGLLGPNGSGKTTTIKCLIGAQIPSQGQILVYGKKAGTVAAKRHIGYIPESARFPKGMSTYEYLMVMARVSGVPTKLSKEVVMSVLQNIGLWNFRFKSPNVFSSGMAKKVLLAQSLLNNPDVLVLDEPAENLDPTTRNLLYNELVKLKNNGKSILISSHVLAELNDIVDEITVIRYGRVIYSGRADSAISATSATYYTIDTNDNSKLVRILSANSFAYKVEKDGTISIKLDSEVQTYIVQNLINENRLTLRIFTRAKKTLQQVYDTLVFHDRSYVEGSK